jgi:hypothetical protein
MEFLNIKHNSTEWDYIWNFVANHPINEDIDEPMVALNGGEEWQYMGSYKHKDKIIHEVRHRLHPKTNGVYKLSLNASDTFDDTQIDVLAPIK